MARVVLFIYLFIYFLVGWGVDVMTINFQKRKLVFFVREPFSASQ